MLRAYARYLRQIGFPFEPAVHRGDARAGTPAISAPARRAVRGALRSASASDARGRTPTPGCAPRIAEALDAVPSLDDDRTLRALLALIDATVRTNVFRPGDGGDAPPRAWRSSSTRARCPTCRCRGRCSRSGCARRASRACTCAAGAIARGGIRWSDRREDFRTEVLGLVKAQMVKNAVIVPDGREGRVRRQARRRRRRASSAPRASPATASSSPGCSTSPTTSSTASSCRRRTPCATTATIRTSSSPPTRARRRSATSPTRSPRDVRVLARRRVRVRRQRRVRPQGDGHHRPRRVGERAPPRAGDRQGRRSRPADRRRHRRHVRRRVRQRPAALARTSQLRRRVRPPPRVPRSATRIRLRRSPSGSGCSSCRVAAGPTTTRR